MTRQQAIDAKCKECIFDDLADGIGKEEEVAVFLPLSYQMGGITIMARREAIELIDMPVEEALRFAITAGMPSGSKSGTR